MPTVQNVLANPRQALPPSLTCRRMKTARVRVPRAYHPRNAAELGRVRERLGGSVSLLFALADRSGAVVRRGGLAAVVLEYEPADAPSRPSGDVVSDRHAPALRDLARMAAKAWAKSMAQPVPPVMRLNEVSEK